MRKPLLLGFILELVLALCALTILIVGAVINAPGLAVFAGIVMAALLYVAVGFLWEHFRPGTRYFDWAVWFWRVVCVEWVWRKFCVNQVYKKFDKWKGWLYLSPAIVLLLIFTVWPIFNTIRMSLLEGYTTMKEAGGATFEFGFGNFARVLKYQGFVNCLKNTVVLCVLTVPISTFLALLIAVCLNSIKFLNRFLQTVFFLPYVTNSIAIGMVFAAMFNMIIGGSVRPDSVGIINNVIEFFGGDYVNWMNAGSANPDGTASIANITVMVIYIVWNALPFKILILLGGLQSVNKQYYEAAKVDGTSRVRTFWRITVPLLSPMLAYVIITGFIGGFKEYSSIVGVFGEFMGPTGDPYALDTMVGFIYRALGNQEGTASASAIILFGIIFAVTMVNLYVSKKKTHY